MFDWNRSWSRGAALGGCVAALSGVAACGPTSPADTDGGQGGGTASAGSAAGGAPTTSGGSTAASSGGTTAGSSGGAATTAGQTGSGGATAGAAGSGGATSNASGGRSSGGNAGATSGGRTGSGGTANTGGGGQASTGGSGGSAGGSTAGKTFNQCRFHFGTTEGIAKNNQALIAQLDLFTPGWVGQKDTFDMDYVCKEIATGGPFVGVVPVMVSYIIAFAARREQGLQDCNVSGTTNLCKYGATYIRNRKQHILDIYTAYAKGFATSCGTTKPLLFMMEPDFYQYSVGGDAQALTPKEAGELMGQFVTIIRQHLPNAVLSMDISPWMPNNGRDWYANFNLAPFTFISTSGGGTDANNAKIRSNNSMTWAGVHQVTGKPILADTGYGAAGASAGHDALWDVVSNLNARIADGVMSINQYNPNSNWPNTIQQLRPQLNSVPCL